VIYNSNDHFTARVREPTEGSDLDNTGTWHTYLGNNSGILIEDTGSDPNARICYAIYVLIP